MLQQTCLRINRYPVDRNSTCYTTLRLVPTEIIVIVLVKELGKSVLFWIIEEGNDTDRCLKVKKVTIVEIGVKSTVNEVVLGVTTGKGWVPDNG